MADATSGRSLLRQVVVDESPGGPDRDLIALQTAELLRTSLLGESSDARTRPASTVACNASNAPAAARCSGTCSATTRDTGVQLAARCALQPGRRRRAALELGLSLHRFFGERWGLGLDPGMPIERRHDRRASKARRSSARTSAGVALLAALCARTRTRSSPRPVPASSLLLVKYDADAREPLQVERRSQADGALRICASTPASSSRRGCASVCAGWPARALQRIKLTFAGNDAGSFGPLLLAGLRVRRARTAVSRRLTARSAGRRSTHRNPRSGQKITPTS